MNFKSFLFVLGFAVLLVASVVSWKLFNPHVRIDHSSLKVVTSDEFPEDLSCEVYLGLFEGVTNELGSKHLPLFEAEGKKERIETAKMNIGMNRSISVYRNDPVKDSYVLYFFTLDDDKKVVAFFDFNLDGEWDVKKTTANSLKEFIRLDNKWIEVNQLGGTRSNNPTTAMGQKKFVFQKQWKPIE